MTVYATEADLAVYLEVNVTELAPESKRLLRLASELIDYATLNRVDTSNVDQMQKVKDATCAQAEYWLETGDPNGIVTQTTKMGFGSFSMDGSLAMMGPRVRQILGSIGLMFRGVSQNTSRTSLASEFFKRPGEHW